MTIHTLDFTRLHASGPRMSRRGLLAWVGSALALGLPATARALGVPAPQRPRLAPLLEAEAVPALRGRIRILDIREPDASDAAPARWPAGAVSAPYARWRGPANNPGALRPLADYAALLRSLGVDETTPVLIVGDADDPTDFGAAARVYWTLRWLGLREVAILNGGAQAWARAGLPMSAHAATPAPSTFTPRPDERVRAQAAEIRAQLGDGRTLLLDARPEPFFRGQRKAPAAARPGTLPGAQAFDNAQWFPDGSGRLPDAAMLARIAAQAPWRSAQTPAATVSFCNTGHWAATNWFVLSELLGVPGVKLYPGSMVEWSQAGAPMVNVPGRAEQLWAQLRSLWSTP
ncbi:MAG: rhodanese-like domain-containing protein [Tibeticola sp.]